MAAEKLTHIKNPLTVIGLFSAISESFGTLILPFLEPKNQSIFIWFVMGFPMLIVTAFFLILWKDAKKLYAPSDYQSDESFFKGHELGRASPKELRRRAIRKLNETNESLNEIREETTTKSSSENNNDTPNTRDQGPKEKTEKPSYAEKRRDLARMRVEAEDIAIQHLTEKFQIDFQRGTKFSIPSRKQADLPDNLIIFDGFYGDAERFHLAEVVILKSPEYGREDRLLLAITRIKLNALRLFPKERISLYLAISFEHELEDTRLQRLLLNDIKERAQKINGHEFPLHIDFTFLNPPE